MKIYFDGCSYTEGKNYLGDDYKNLRWSKLLCDKLDAEEYNYSDSGSSNQRMLRNLATEHCNKDYDLAIIQLSYPSRNEFYNGTYFEQVNNNIKRTVKKYTSRNNSMSVSLAWQMYYRNIYEREYGLAYELTVFNSIKYICQAKNIKLIMLSCWGSTKLPYDHMLSNYEPVSKDNGHPSVNAQKFIANDIYNLL